MKTLFGQLFIVLFVLTSMASVAAASGKGHASDYFKGYKKHQKYTGYKKPTARPPAVPELNASGAASALGLVIGSGLLFAGTRRRRTAKH